MANPFDQFDESGPSVVTVGQRDPSKVAAEKRAADAAAAAAESHQWEREKHDAETAVGIPPEQMHATGPEFLKLLPPSDAAQVKALAEGRMAFPAGRAAASPYWQQRLAQVSQYDPEFDAINYNARAGTRRDFTSGAGSKNVRALNTAIGHLGQLGDQIDGTASHGGFPGATLINRAENAISRGAGSSGITKFEQTAGALAGELTQVYRQSGGAEADIQRYISELDSAASREQKMAAIANMTGLLKSRLDALNDQYTKGMGTTSGGLELLDPHSKEVLAKYLPGFTADAGSAPPPGTGGGPAAPPAGGGPSTPPSSPWDQPSGPANTIATGSTQTRRNDRLSAQVDAMMNAGASEAMVNAVLKQQGFPAIRPDQFREAQKWMKENPGKQYYGADITKDEPLSLLSRVAGSEFGSGLANYADAATAGVAGSLAGEKGRGALDAMRQVNPDASTAGAILGGITGAMGGEMAVAARAPAALARFAPRIADTLYGGLTGFNNAPEGEGLMGAGIGAAAGGIGGAVGERAMAGLGNAATGVRNEAVQALRERGIPMTVGQAVGNSGIVGAGVKKLEDAATALPFIGNMIEARRMEGLRGWNREAFQDAAAPGAQITATGAEGMGQLRGGVADAYNRALDPVTIDANDPALINDLGGVIQYVNARIPADVDGARDAAMASLAARINGAVDPNTDTISGRGFQEAYRGLARTGRERSARDYGHEIGQSMRLGQDALGEALERQNPGAFGGFIEANAANRRANVLADALKNAANQTDELVTPAQLNRADTGSTSRLEGKINSASGNRPFYDLATAGQAVLPSRLPDSGTMTRLLTGGALTGALGGGGAAIDGAEGAATGTGLGLGATLALLAGGSHGAQALALRALLDRPDFAVRVGEQLNRNARIGGWGGAGALTPLVVGQ